MFLKKKEKNEANLRLSNFKKSFTTANHGGVQTLQEKIKYLPLFFK